MPGVADLVIVLVLLLGLYVGVARGLYGPLATEGSLVVAIFLVTTLHGGIDSFLPVGARLVVSIFLVFILAGLLRVALAPVVAVVRRTPGLGRIDAPAGGVVHALAAFLVVYLVLGLVLDFDRSVYPLLRAGVVSAHQLQQYQQAVEQRPWLKGYLDPQALREQEAQAARAPVTVDTLAKIEGFLNFYLQDLRNPLLKSRLGPAINYLGSQIPVIGRPRPYLGGASPQ